MRGAMAHSHLRSVILALLLAVPQAAIAAPLTARGNEPGWQAVISETEITFRPLDAAPVTITPVPKPVTADGVETYAGTSDGKAFSLAIGGTICVDTMSGMPFPKTATVIFGERSFKGCAGEPASLLRGDWAIAAIGEAPVLRGSKPSLTFAAEGRVNGNGSCNRYFGSFKLSGETLTIAETGTTRMMCDQPLMEQERRLLQALESVRRFEVDASGGLRLVGDDGRTAVSLRH
jgi:heat shock protein HslJ